MYQVCGASVSVQVRAPSVAFGREGSIDTHVWQTKNLARRRIHMVMP